MSFYERYISELIQRYPKASQCIDFRDRLSALLVSPHVLHLPLTIKKEAEDIVRAFFTLRQNPERAKRLSSLSPEIKDPGNTSALMSYDFHIDDGGHLRLIEINTNASMSLLVDTLHSVQNVKNPFCADFQKEIIATFETEYLQATGQSDAQSVCIVDEKPLQQRMYAEFELYRELFEKKGRRTWIADPHELSFVEGKLKLGNHDIDLVYNRSTDFYFERPESAALKAASDSRVACVTPHPYEYRLLADKERLLELSKNTESIDSVIAKTLIRTVNVSEIDEAQLWSERKKWFFKPMRSYGGKAVYRGASVTRSTFANILKGNYLVQEDIPPAMIKFSADVELKYDLRFFVYRDRIQLSCARLYRGQMTNAQTPEGGVAVINWTN